MTFFNLSDAHHRGLEIGGFVVATGDEKPPISSGYDLDHPPFRTCGKYKGTPPAAMPAMVKCADGAFGRYTYVFTPRKYFMILCEVQVYGVRK